MKICNLYLNYAGFCLAKEKHSIKDGANKMIKYHALFGLIQHPEKGYILFDTGYTYRFFDATRKFPSKIYALITKVSINKQDEIKNQMIRNGIRPEEINHILLSHFHADHTGGLIDFPNAKIYCTKKAWMHTQGLSQLFSFSKGVLKKQHPENMADRIQFIEVISSKTTHPILGVEYDIFNDQSILAYDLPGHAAGQFGIRLKTNKKNYFLIADACWLSASYRNNIYPHPIVKLFFHSWKDFKQTLSKLNKFHRLHPEELIVPTHCKQTTDPLINENISWNEL